MSSSQLPSWPGLPRGVQFNPSDSDLLWHLAAEIGNGRAHRHPFISEFIKSGDGDGGFGHTHPEDMPGMSQDGHALYFFHKNVELFKWQKSGASSIILDGSLEGLKEVFVLTDWELHQFRMKNRMEDEASQGELVVSKIFYNSQNNHCEWAAKAPVQSAQDDSVTYNDSKEEDETQLANHSVNMATDSYFVEGNGNDHQQMLVEMYPDQDKLSSCKDVLDTKQINHENEINQAETELDHMSLQERYRILLANKHAARLSAETCAANASDGSSMQMDAKTSGPLPKSESEQINLEGTTIMEDIRSMLQEVTSAPSITGSMDADSILRDSGTYLVDVKMEPLLEGYVIHPSESPCVKSIVKKTHTRTLNCNEDQYCSRQRKKRDSSEKVLEEDAYKHDEGIAPSRRRKKKTATDSIETALEEDAPGLLQILLDRGIVVKEIKLYDVGEDDEMLADCTESDFQDLENVITKLFPQRASLLKSAARFAKGGGKAIYCLACLISLIEQSRYLQFRDCPVEWGWCRDLQSFIFVFRSHNRLVLERPEYGYATYFFEIVQSVPVEWQIRRLVTAMKLSNCGRTALIENRPLLIGEDLSEGEAKVLEEYGWIRNTGLGTMLNYRDRVVHDRWNEKYSTDWRMKIGKLLMNGYSEGQLILTHGPADMLSEEEIKLEDPV